MFNDEKPEQDVSLLPFKETKSIRWWIGYVICLVILLCAGICHFWPEQVAKDDGLTKSGHIPWDEAEFDRRIDEAEPGSIIVIPSGTHIKIEGTDYFDIDTSGITVVGLGRGD